MCRGSFEGRADVTVLKNKRPTRGVGLGRAARPTSRILQSTCGSGHWHHDRNCDSDPGVSAIVQVVAVVIVDVHIVVRVPVGRPILRPRVHHQERIPAILEARVAIDNNGLRPNAKKASCSEGQTELSPRDVEATVAAALHPGAMIGPPVSRATQLPGWLSSPSAIASPVPLPFPISPLPLRGYARWVAARPVARIASACGWAGRCGLGRRLGTPLALVALFPIRTLWRRAFRSRLRRLATLRTSLSLVRFCSWRWWRFGLSCRSILRLVSLVLLSVRLGRLRINLVYAKHKTGCEKQI
jgi:hypothetical protein